VRVADLELYLSNHKAISSTKSSMTWYSMLGWRVALKGSIPFSLKA
jgi:hypothetical protein